MCVRANEASPSAARLSLRPCGHRCGGMLFLLICFAWVFVGADWAPEQAKHMLVVQLSDQACHSALREAADLEPSRLLLARSAWRPLYRLSAPPAPAPSLEALWEESASLWAEGDFESALQHAAPLLPVLHSRANYAQGESSAQAIQALAQLRLTLLLLEARDHDAEEEANLLLSRHSAATYCNNTEFPEACALLRRREALVPLFWSTRTADLTRLSEFAAESGHLLSQISQPTPDSLLWESIVDGLPEHQWLHQGSCAHIDDWRHALKAWERELYAQRRSLSAQPQARPVLRSAMWTTVGVGAVFTLAALVRTAQIKPRRDHLESCIDSLGVCPSIGEVQASYTRWKRAQRQARGFWAGAAISATAVIPLHHFSRSRTDRPQSEQEPRRDLWDEEMHGARAERSALGDGLPPE